MTFLLFAGVESVAEGFENFFGVLYAPSYVIDGLFPVRTC
jgi:hypothetical protein